MSNLFEANEGGSDDETITVNLYCDESKNRRCPLTGERWHYLGILTVPSYIESALLNDLICRRHRIENRSELNTDSEYFPKNDQVVHFRDLDANSFHVSKRWWNYILHPDSQEKIFFNVTGINETMLDQGEFGNEDVFQRIYNRFFRSCVTYSMKKFFPGSSRKVQQIYHEQGNQEHHEFFPWHSIYRIDQEEENITFENREIDFINDSHRENERGTLIQLMDVILGVTTNIFHDSTENEKKIKLTKKASGLIKRLIKNPNNPNSNYCPGYHRRMDISFFPKQELTEDTEYSEYHRKNNFYRNRRIVFLERGQKKLFN